MLPFQKIARVSHQAVREYLNELSPSNYQEISTWDGIPSDEQDQVVRMVQHISTVGRFQGSDNLAAWFVAALPGNLRARYQAEKSLYTWQSYVVRLEYRQFPLNLQRVFRLFLATTEALLDARD